MNIKIDKADYAILYGVSLEQWPAWLLLKETNDGTPRLRKAATSLYLQRHVLLPRIKPVPTVSLSNLQRHRPLQVFIALR